MGNKNNYDEVPAAVVTQVASEIEEVLVLAEKKNANGRRKGISHEEVVSKFSEWARDDDKDQDLCSGRFYNGPEIVAETMARYFPEKDRSTVKILDMAAGAGRVGVELAGKGFKFMDAFEPCQGMLSILVEKGIYDKTFLNPIVEIVADSYDAVVFAGGMGKSHNMPVEGINEMLRIVRPDGMIFIVMREENLTTVKEYAKLKAFMQELADKKLWTRVERKVVPKDSFKNNGVVFVYQKLQINL